MDSLLLKNISTNCILGSNPEERTRKRRVIISLEFFFDFTEAGKNDDLTKTIDYGQVTRDVVDFAENSRFHLIEALAYAISEMCLEKYPVIDALTVRILKPAPCQDLQSASARVSRARVHP